MKFDFKDIDKNNWRDVVELKVKENQISFIESNALSIAESKYIDNWIVKAIYLEGELIGFAMYGFFHEDGGRLWLDRFMIDRDFQGKGYAKKLLIQLIRYIANYFNVDQVYLSIFEDNEHALKLYKNVGFRFTGELDCGGEKVMELSGL